jgi:hypothetical protein
MKLIEAMSNKAQSIMSNERKGNWEGKWEVERNGR